MPSEFEGKPIKCRAAVAWEAKAPLVIEEITVDPPKSDEVRIKMVSSGICHSDFHMVSGHHPASHFPLVAGHEGAGIVESVGDLVTTVKPGDPVIPLWFPQCYKCKYCLSSKSNLCTAIRDISLKGYMGDGTTRFSCRGQRILHYVGVSSFSEYTVCAEISVSLISRSAPLSSICLLGCAVPTGYGGAVNTAEVHSGSTVGIWGLGGIGLSAVMGCKASGASKIIGIDLNPAKFELAKKLGCTDCVNPKDLPNGQSLEDYLIQMTDGGLDYAIECIGTQITMRQAFESLHKGWGVAVAIGLVGKGQEISFDPYFLLQGRIWKGSYFGGYKSRDSMPKLVQLVIDGHIKIDELISGYIPLEKINEGFHDMLAGKSIRTIIKF